MIRRLDGTQVDSIEVVGLTDPGAQVRAAGAFLGELIFLATRPDYPCDAAHRDFIISQARRWFNDYCDGYGIKRVQRANLDYARGGQD